MSNPGEPADEARRPATGTTSGLRKDIDAGRTGDKANAVDPAAAPLGTDEESAGKPLEAEVIAFAEQRERRRKIGTDPNRTRAGGMEHGGGKAWIAAIVLMIAILAAVFLLMR